MYILFPGRHHLLTEFQHRYLGKVINELKYKSITGEDVLLNEKVEAVIFAVTSANHSNTRRNPLPLYLRAIQLEKFSIGLNADCLIFSIDDIGQHDEFDEYTIKKIFHDSDGKIDLNPSNCLVLCSTPVMKLYQKKCFNILGAEYLYPDEDQPWDVLTQAIEENQLIQKMHSSSKEIWKKYNLIEKVTILFNDGIIGPDGDLTQSRDYNIYVRQMDEIASIKYNETRKFIRPGRIGDIGCAVGSWIKLAQEESELFESDFYGIEVSRKLYELCQQRKHNGEFKNPFTFFAQKNAVTGLVFSENSMNTINTSSLTHEIESYGNHQDLLDFIENRFRELCVGGVWINRDVVGPENFHKIIACEINSNDGQSHDAYKTFSNDHDYHKYISTLSTFGRFLCFIRDFRKQDERIDYKILNQNGDAVLIEIKLGHACEFLYKKDYTDNWTSEMNEMFCFWSYKDWLDQLSKTGYKIHHNSHSYQNDWLIQNRFIGKVAFYELHSNGKIPIAYPNTHFIIIAEKIL